MTESTEKNVLMKCEVCGYQEYASASDLALLRHLPPVSKVDKQLCPFCLNDMYRADSLRFYKDNLKDNTKK